MGGHEEERPAVAAPMTRPVEVRSQMTAAVVSVEVATGDEVGAGQTLLVVESMKMEIPVLAPVAGRVAELDVEPRDIVAEGDVLAVIDPT